MAFSQSATSFGTSSYNTGTLLVDWKEDDEAHTITFNLPGLKKQDATLQIVGSDTLQISGRWKSERLPAAGNWHVKERPTGSFTREFKLQSEVRADEVTAYDADGVLVVRVPKMKMVRNIPISSL